MVYINQFMFVVWCVVGYCVSLDIQRQLTMPDSKTKVWVKRVWFMWASIGVFFCVLQQSPFRHDSGEHREQRQDAAIDRLEHDVAELSADIVDLYSHD